jgi:cell fate regulator YaaT (PSP1 superfamily)
MPLHHLVRTGAFGHVGGYVSAGALRYPRGSRVIVRSGRGLEIGEVLSPPEETDELPETSGTILRQVTLADDLLQARLQKHRQAALEACARRIEELGLDVVLVDVEHLFDGRTLVFHFLGEMGPQLDELTAELAAAYDSQVQFRQFARLLEQGCGPGCGTEAAGGCGSCAAGCAIAGACASGAKHRHAG